MISVRRSTDQDREHLKSCIKADPFHEEQDPRSWSETMTFADDEGPVFHVVSEPGYFDELRIHIQFGESKLRTARTLIQGWPKYKQVAKAQGFKSLVFDSTNAELINFCTKYFGFKHDSDCDYRLPL